MYPVHHPEWSIAYIVCDNPLTSQEDQNPLYPSVQIRKNDQEERTQIVSNPAHDYLYYRWNEGNLDFASKLVSHIGIEQGNVIQHERANWAVLPQLRAGRTAWGEQGRQSKAYWKNFNDRW